MEGGENVNIWADIVSGGSSGVAEVLDYAVTTFTGFDAIIAASLGIALAVGLIRKFVRTH